MKRARTADAPHSSIVHLNVGGRVFQTSRETLYGSAFFTSLLEHDFDGDKDPDGNIFVDRDPKLFQVILNSLRTARRPNQRIIRLWKHELLAECQFYATESVAARIMGRKQVQILTLATRVFATCSVVLFLSDTRKTKQLRMLCFVGRCAISEHARAHRI